MEPAGTKMIEYEHVKGMGDCSTQDPTYVVNPDYDSIQMGEEVDRTACMFNSQVFNQQNNPCFVPTHTLSDFFPSDKIPIKIKRCQDFFVYELPNIAQCDGRYCAIWWNSKKKTHILTKLSQNWQKSGEGSPN